MALACGNPTVGSIVDSALNTYGALSLPLTVPIAISGGGLRADGTKSLIIRNFFRLLKPIFTLSLYDAGNGGSPCPTPSEANCCSAS